MISRANAIWVMRADAILNFIVGVHLFIWQKALIDLTTFPDTNKPIYASVLGAALIGLSLAVWLAANHPEQSRDTIFASIVAKGLAGVSVLFWRLLGGTDLPSIPVTLIAVGAQVLFVLGEAAYLLSSSGKKK